MLLTVRLALRGCEGLSGGFTYTKGSLTETTKTFPASFNFFELIYPGTWVAEHAGPWKISVPRKKASSGTQSY